LPDQPPNTIRNKPKLLDQVRAAIRRKHYRYDPSKHECIKTIELVIERKNWIPDPQRIPPNKIMSLKIKYGEVELGRQVKSLGGRWDRKQRAWKLPFKYVQILQLENRIKK